MRNQNDLTTDVAKQLLQENQQYIKFGLVIEAAIESLRKDTIDRLGVELDAVTEAARLNPDNPGWSTAKKVPSAKNYPRQFFRKLYRKSRHKGGWAGIWIGIWNDERAPLTLELCAQDWPEDDADTKDAVTTAFTEFVRGSEGDLWTEDPRNKNPERRVSWHLNGDQAFLVENRSAGDASLMLKELLTGLMDAFDKKAD